MISQLLFPIAATAICYGLLYLTRSVYQALTYPLRNVQGPRNPSFIFGNFKELQNDRQKTAKWRDEFGPTFRFKSLFSMNTLYTSDVKALNHIIANVSIYQTPEFGKRVRKAVLGNGILTVDMEDHKRQATFATPQIRALTEIFVEKAVQLRDIWASQLSQKNDAPAPIDVYSWIKRMTLDVIGEAGFNYQFNALTTTEDSDELSRALTELTHGPNMQRNTLVLAVQARVPILKHVQHLLGGQDVAVNAHDQMFSVAGRIVSESIRALGGEKSVGDKKDVLSVLLRANLDMNLPANQRLSENEVVSQIPTFLIAGHETTSTAAAWALNALSLNPEMQTKLREELFTLSTENPTMDELNSLPYLESVVREVLRVYAPVTFLDRVALEDDVLPLSKPYIDKAGEAHDTLHIPKGQVIHVPIWNVNTDPEIWGDDATEFKPQRWTNVPGAASGIPSIWASLFTFFAGPRNCIGFKFALVEFKALLFTLIRAFEFEPAVPAGGIVPTSAGLQSPIILAAPEKGTSLPLRLKRYEL
ncbi:cytochrome P450, partial [Mycena polygramma]